MTPEALEALRQLLTRTRQLSLAVLVDGGPAIGLLPFVVAPDFGSFLVRASGLARHSKGLQLGAPFDALIHVPDDPEGDPLQVPRVTVRGRVALLDPTRSDDEALQRSYVEAFPSSAQTLGLGDFHSYRLEIAAGRLVTGFGGAINLSRESLAALARPPH